MCWKGNLILNSNSDMKPVVDVLVIGLSLLYVTTTIFWNLSPIFFFRKSEWNEILIGFEWMEMQFRGIVLFVMSVDMKVFSSDSMQGRLIYRSCKGRALVQSFRVTMTQIYHIDIDKIHASKIMDKCPMRECIGSNHYLLVRAEFRAGMGNVTLWFSYLRK